MDRSATVSSEGNARTSRGVYAAAFALSGTKRAYGEDVDQWVTSVVESLGYVGIALLMALENIFPPIPSELIMPLVGYTAAQGTLNLWAAIAAATAATVVGALPWYALGRWAQRERVYGFVDRHGHWLTISRRELEKADRWFQERGRWVVALGRLVPGVRTLISVPAGFCNMPLGRFVGYSTLGTVVWLSALAWAGHLLGQSYEQVAKYIGPATKIILVGIALTYLVRLVRAKLAKRHAAHAA